MDLFKLKGTIDVNNDEANHALEETGQEGERAESRLGKAFEKIGNGALALGKAVGKGMLVAGAAVAGLVAGSIKSYADYEQLVGGVETLFGAGGKSIEEYAESVGKSVDECRAEYDKLMRSQSKVMDNAKVAYKTAGLSANEYMETVTSFSASLLQSLGGDTEKAAEVADRAIIDMADNANKMGTSMELIQNAYNGFAKGNYTMLDNLKLGYGGTQEEMKRLIQDAAKLTDVQKELGITVDANDMSFANVTNAISIMQKKMGIAGTTAKEAASTISGSLGMMKSSWSNLMTAISDDNADFDSYITAFVDSVGAVAENLMPRIEIALNGVVKLIDKLAPVIMGKIPELLSTLLPSIVNGATNLVKSIVDIIPGLMSTLTDLIPEVLNGFIAIFDSLIDSLPTVLDRLLEALGRLAPALINGIVTVVTKLANKLPSILEVIVKQVPVLIKNICQALLDNIPVLIDGLVTLVTSIVDYLPTFIQSVLDLVVNVITMLVEQLPVILPSLIEALMSMLTLLIEQIPVILPKIVEACLTIITLLQEQLPVLIPMLVNALIDLVYLLIEQLPVIIPMVIEACVTIIMAIIEALPEILKALTDALPEILQAIWDAIVMIFKNLPEWFGQIFQAAWDIIKGIWSVVVDFFAGIWDGICEVFSAVAEWFGDIFSDAWQAIKDAFSAVGDFFQGCWDSIVNVFSGVVDWFGNIFKKAWKAVKDVFAGVRDFFVGIWDTISDAFSAIGTAIGDAISGAVKSAINGVLSIIEGIINGFFKLINGAITCINYIPGVNISKIEYVKFARLAEGGVVDEPTPAVFGEDGAEAVVPLEKNQGWLKKVASNLHEFIIKDKGGLEGLMSNRFVDLQAEQISESKKLNEKVDNIIELLGQFFPELIDAVMNQSMVLDDGTLVAKTVHKYDEALGKLAILKGRGR